MKINNERIRKILLINLKYLGDLVVCSPAYRSLKEYFPDSEISILIRKGYGTLFESDKNIDKVIEFDLCNIRKLHKFRRISAELKFFKKIRNEKFDLVITFHPTDRLAFWSFGSGAKYRVGYRDQSFNYLFNINIPAIEESKSYLEYYMDAIRAIDVPITGKNTYITLNESYKREADSFFEHNNISKSDLVVGIHPGASRTEKRWGAIKFAELSDMISQKGLKVLLFCGPDDKAVTNEILTHSKSENILVEDTSKSILYLAALINRCAVVVCNDSASAHIAAALNKKTISLMSREKIHCWKIYDEDSRFKYLFGNVCDECSNGICEGSKCLREIPVIDVYDKLTASLDAR